MKKVETYGRVAYTDAGMLVQELFVSYCDESGEVLKEERLWEVVPRLGDKESVSLHDPPKQGKLIQDLTVPGASLRR